MNKLKKTVREFNVSDDKTETTDYKNRDINDLIKEMKRQDHLEKIEREERVNKIFQEVIIDGK